MEERGGREQTAGDTIHVLGGELVGDEEALLAQHVMTPDLDKDLDAGEEEEGRGGCAGGPKKSDRAGERAGGGRGENVMTKGPKGAWSQDAWEG